MLLARQIKREDFVKSVLIKLEENVSGELADLPNLNFNPQQWPEQPGNSDENQ